MLLGRIKNYEKYYNLKHKEEWRNSMIENEAH